LYILYSKVGTGSAGDPDPEDPHVFGLQNPDPDPLVRGTDPDSSLSENSACIVGF
jgi:hypothetical protein